MEGAILSRVGILGLFVLNRVRASDPQWHPYTQIWVKHPLCPPSPAPGNLYTWVDRKLII